MYEQKYSLMHKQEELENTHIISIRLTLNELESIDSKNEALTDIKIQGKYQISNRKKEEE